MRSKASFRSHPIHPALVHFPLAFLIGAFGFDLAGSWSSVWLPRWTVAPGWIPCWRLGLPGCARVR